MPPGVGVLTCRRQIPCVSPLNLAWGSGDVVDGCSTHKFLYYCKKVECYCILNWIIAKCISEIYLLITMIYKISAYHFRPCIAAREQCQLSIILKSCLGTCACKEDWASFLKALRSLIGSSHIVNLFLQLCLLYIVCKQR